MSDRIAPDILADVSEPRDVCISPDGTKVVYLVRPVWVRGSECVKSALWIADVGKEYSARQLTFNDTENHSPKFSPDGNYISFLSDRAQPGKKCGLYLLPLAGGEAWPLTSTEHEMGIGTYEWKPDSKAIAFVSADEKSEEQKKQQQENGDACVYDEGVGYGRLRIVTIDTKEVKALECTKNHVSQIAWNKAGDRIAYSTIETPRLNDWGKGSHLYIADIDSDSSQELYYVQSALLSLCWHDESLMWSAGYIPDTRNTSRSMYALSIKDNKQAPRRVAYGEDDCVGDVKVRNDTVFVLVHQGLRDVVKVFDHTELYRDKKTIGSWDVNIKASKTTLVLTQGTTGTPVEVYSIMNGHKIQLSQHGKLIAERNIGKAYLCEHTHEDGTPIDGFYAVPTALESAFQENKPQPTVLVVHGGPYTRVTDCFDIFWHFTTFFMSLGYLVLCPNYRGGSSHGHTYAYAVQGDASQSYQDVIWLIQKGIAEGKIDPDHVAITGWSQGGYLAYLSVTRDDTFHFRAAVAGAGVSDWTSIVSTTDLPLFESDMSGPAPWDLEDISDVQSRKCSPIFHMQGITTPLLIIHGEEDQRTPIEQAIGFYRGMKAKNKVVKMVTYPGEGHGSPVPWQKKRYIHMLETMEKFLKDHMV